MSTLKVDTLSNSAGSQSTSILNAINGSAKAWVNFNGTGTVAIGASYNVSSITDNGTGDYTINFTTALPAATYAALLGGRSTTTTSQFEVHEHNTATRSTTALRIQAILGGVGVVDPAVVSVAIFR